MKAKLIIGVVLTAAGAMCVLLREAIIAAQRDAIAPTGPPPYLSSLGMLLLFVGLAWFGVAWIVRSR